MQSLFVRTFDRCPARITARDARPDTPACPASWRALAVAAVLLLPAVAQGAEPAGAAEQQSFLGIVWQGLSWIGPLIGLMSLVSLSFIIEHFWTTRRSTMVTEAETRAMRELIEKRQFKECIDRVSRSETMFGDVLSVGLRHGRHGFDAMQEAVEERAAAWRSRLFRKVEYLNIIGNLSPLMGLLGTVLGMIKAFGKMGGGAYGPEKLAEGISLALVSTFLGLVVAIVSLGFFGICRNRVDSLTVAAHAAVIDVLEYFRPSPLLANGTASPSGQPPAEAVPTA